MRKHQKISLTQALPERKGINHGESSGRFRLKKQEDVDLIICEHNLMLKHVRRETVHTNRKVEVLVHPKMAEECGTSSPLAGKIPQKKEKTRRITD